MVRVSLIFFSLLLINRRPNYRTLYASLQWLFDHFDATIVIELGVPPHRLMRCNLPLVITTSGNYSERHGVNAYEREPNRLPTCTFKASAELLSVLIVRQVI